MKCEDITKEVESIILDNNLVISGVGRYVTKRITCFNDFIDVTLLSNQHFKFEQNKGVLDTLAKSKEELAQFKKRVGKYVTKSNIDELRKLNLKDWQLGKRL